MNKVFTDNGWKDYVYWQTEDRKTLKKINRLIEEVYENKIALKEFELKALTAQILSLIHISEPTRH